MNIKLLYGTAAIALATPSFAIAADASQTEGEEIVVVATGFAQPADETGQAISVITRSRLEELQSVSIADVLRTLPAVSVASRGPVGTQSSVYIRGGNSSQTLVLVDGVRVNDPSSPNAAFDFGSLLVGNAERVEVLRGPNSIIWGSQAIGGVVNIETAKPAGALKVRAAAEYGAYDSATGHLNLSGSHGAIGYSFGGAYYRTDGYSVFTGGTEKDGGRQGALNGRITIALTDNLELDFRGNYNESRSDYDSDFSGGADSLANSHNSQWFAFAGLNLDLMDDRFHSRLSYSRYDIERVGTDPVIFSFNNYVATGVTEQIEYRGAFDLSESVQFIAGLQHQRINSSSSYEGAAPDLAKDSVNGGYVQLSLQPVDGLTATAGVRYDDYSDYGGQTTLGGNLAYTPNEGRTVFRATYAEGFRAPTLTEGQPPYGNPALKPETAKNIDLGIEQALIDDRLNVTVTWFQRRNTNLITYSFVTSQSENIGKSNADGLEFSLQLRPTDRLSVHANYARVDAENRSSAVPTRLPLRPKHSASLTADWETPVGLKLGTTVWLIGDSFDDNANSVVNDGYARTDIRASFPINETLELYGRIDNLMNAHYETVAGYTTAGRAAFVGARLRM